MGPRAYHSPSSSFAASVIRSWVQGGSHTTSTSADLTSSTFSTSYSTIPGKVSATGHPGVEDCDIDMPATPERVWRALRNARRAGDAPSGRL